MTAAMIRGRRVLVTGGSGVIGRELLVRLQTAGARVLSVDREPLPGAVGGGVEQVRVDLSEGDLAPLRSFAPEVVFHLAGASVPNAATAAYSEVSWRDNLLASHRLVELAIRLAKARVVVFASSDRVYRPDIYRFSEPREAPVYLREDDAIAPRDLHGAAKYYVEGELDFMRATARPELRVVHARIFLAYGRGSRDEISRWVRAALNREPIEIQNEGNRFAYTYAGDVAQGLIRLAESDRAQGAVNLASGRSDSVAGALAALERHLPVVRDIIRRRTPERPFEASGAELSKLRNLTGWEPDTDLYDGIGKIVAYERSIAGGAP